MSRPEDDENPVANPDYHEEYDTVGMSEEEYKRLYVPAIPVPETGILSIGELIASTEGRKDQRKKVIAAALEQFSEDEKLNLLYKWEFWARPNQIAPTGDWTYWLLLAGRGFGKTRTGAEWVNDIVQTGNAKRISLVAPTAADVRKVMVEGESGIMAISPPWNRPKFEPSKLQLTWPNGAIAQMFSAEEPERLRGPQCDAFWADELAAWKNMQETWDMLQFGFRLGRNPRGVITTTPKPVPIVRELVREEMAEAKLIRQGDLPVTEKTIVLTKGSTYENKANLASPFFKKVVSKYEGTRLGRQELEAEILEDMPGALWARGNIDRNRKPLQGEQFDAKMVKAVIDLPDDDDPSIFLQRLREVAQKIIKSVPEDLMRVIVAVDPNASNDEGSDEIGITVTGKGISGHGYVLADVSMRGSPYEWAATAVLTHDAFGADRIVGEANQGGNMVEYTVATSAKALKMAKKRKSDFIPITLVHATRGKVTRAESPAALYEQNRVSHIGTHTILEDQMCLFTIDFNRKEMNYSPDRVDSLVWGLTHLFLENSDTGLLEFVTQQVAQRQADKEAKDDPGNMVRMSVSPNVSTVYGRRGQVYPVVDCVVLVDPDDVPGLRGAGLKEITE